MALDNKQIMTYESLGKVLDYIDKGDSVRVVKYNESITDIKKAVNFSNGVQTLMNIKGFVGTLDGKSYTFLGDIPYVGDESGNPVFRGVSLAKRTDSVLGDIFEPLDVEFKYDGGTTQYKMSSVERIQDNTTVNYLDSVAKINDTCNASGEGLVTMNVTDMPIEIDSVDMILQGAIPAIEVSDDNWFFHGYAVAKDGSTPPVETPCDVVVKYDTTENKYVATAKKLGSTEWELYELDTKINDANGNIELVHYKADGAGEDTEEWLKKIAFDVIAGKMVQVSIKGNDRLDNEIRTIAVPYFDDDGIMLSFVGNGGEIATRYKDGEGVSSQPYGMFYVGMKYDGTNLWQEYYPAIPIGGTNRIIGVSITDDGIEYFDNVLEDMYGADLESIAHSLASMWSPENGMNIIYPDEYLNDRYIPELALYLDTNDAPYDDPSFDNMRGKSLQFGWVGCNTVVDPVTHVASVEAVFSNSYGEVVFVLTLVDEATMEFSTSLEIRPAESGGEPDEYVKKIVKSNDGSFITITPNTGDPFTFSASGSGGGVTMEQVDAEIALKTYSKTESDGKYVAQVAGKGLSTNDYTTTEKTKLAGIEEQAQKNVQSDWNATSGDSFIKNKPSVYTKTEVDTELAKKVDKVTGKDLSTNDFTNALKTKLDDLYTKAQLDTEFAKKVDKTADDYLTKAELITDGIKITPNKGSAIEYKLNEYVEKAEMTSENLVKITQHDGTTVEQKPYLAKVETIQVDGLDEYKITDNKGVETKLDVYKRADTFGRDEDAVPTDTTTYGKKQIDDMINALEGVTMKVVTSVPTPATAVAGTIYICDGTMYLCYENAGSKVVAPIGDTAPDLTQYWKKTDGDLMSTAEHTKLTQDYTKAEVDTELAKKLNVDDAYVVKAELDSAKRLKLTDSAGGVVTQNSFIEKVEKDTNKLKLTNNAGGVVTQEDFLMKVEEVATGYKFTRSDNTTSTFLKITDAEWADITDYIDEKIDELV